MPKPIHTSQRAKRAPSKPHVRPEVPPRAANGDPAAPPNTRPSKAPASNSPRVRQSQCRAEAELSGLELCQSAAIIQTTEGLWEWTCYDRRGARIYWQDKCKDLPEACVNLLEALASLKVSR